MEWRPTRGESLAILESSSLRWRRGLASVDLLKLFRAVGHRMTTGVRASERSIVRHSPSGTEAACSIAVNRRKPGSC